MGLLLPRLTTTERNAITAPIPESLLIYNTTTQCFEAWNQTNTSWVSFGCINCTVPTGVSASAAPNPLCVGSTLNLTASASNATTWQWTGPNGFTSTSQNPTIVSITAAATGIYTLIASNTCAAAAPVTVLVTVNSIPTSVTASAAPNPVCQGSTLTLTGAATGATSWAWTGPNGFSSTLQNPTVANIPIAGAGVYSLIGSSGSCAAAAVNTASVTVAVPAKQTFAYTGTDQTYTIPATCVSFVKIQCWGAAGGTWVSVSGAGGYSEATFDLSTSVLSVGQIVSVMVGKGGAIGGPGTSNPNAYGFSGGNKSLVSTGSGSGGGLSGVFTGTTPILATDNARAVVVAGGGGGTGEDDCFSLNFRLHAGSGNQTGLAGGMPNMQGVDGNAGAACGIDGYGGGGGGYLGGAAQTRSGGSGLDYAGNGGTGFTHGTATAPSVLFTPEFSATPPNTGDSNYNGVAGKAVNMSMGNHGLVVITPF